MATYLADRVIVYDGRPGIECMASAPMSLLEAGREDLKMITSPVVLLIPFG